MFKPAMFPALAALLCFLALPILSWPVPAQPVHAQPANAQSAPAQPALASDPEVLKGPRPGWVRPADIPEIDPDLELEIVDGVYLHVLESQVRWEGETATTYFRHVKQPVDRSGLEIVSNVRLFFDPRKETMTLNAIRIRRNGVWRDVTAEARPELLRQEGSIGDGILDGELTALIILPNIQVGDLVDYEATLVTRREIFSRHFAEATSLDLRMPVGLKRTVISVPAGTPAQVRTHGKTSVEAKQAQSDGFDSYTFEQSSLHALPGEDNRPGSHVHWAFAEVSTWPDWSSFIDDILPHYDPAIDLPAGFIARLDGIAETFATPEDRMTEALRLVQDEIRYLSLTMGTGGYIPRRPETVLESGYGDCKDKSLLLAAALRHLGIEARVALVNTWAGDYLPNRLPGNLVFDHAITRAETGGKVYWLDPTQTHEGGRGASLVQADLQNALVIKAGVTGFEPMPEYVPDGYDVDVTEHFFIPKSAEQDLRLEVISVYHGPSANSARSRLATDGRTKLTRRYLEYYESLYPGIRAKGALQSVDDRDANRLTTTEHYLLAPDMQRLEETMDAFPFKGVTATDILTTVTSAGRTAPLDLGQRRKVRHSVYIDYDKLNWEKSKPAALNSPYFSFTRRSENGAFYVWTAERKQRIVPREALRGYLADVDKAGREGYRSYEMTEYLSDLDSYKPGPASALGSMVDDILKRAVERASQKSQ